MSMTLPWKDAWITGAGRGIGRALAVLLAQRGVKVYASSRTSADLDSLIVQCQNSPGEIIALPLDITHREGIEEIMASWLAGSGCPDLVILNAGTHDPFSAREMSAQRCQQLFDINLQGTLNCLDPVLKQMLVRNSGQIAVMASVAGFRGLPTAAAYGASKAALINFCEALKLDLIGTPIKIQVINPGFIRTSLTAKNDFKMPALMEADMAAQETLKGLLKNTFEISYPARFVYFLKFLRLLPYHWYFKLIGKMVKV